jgi:PIN domain nuclease of toxin-antitoxin system
MRQLLDTQIALWVVTDDPRLGQRARELIIEPDARNHVSVVSIWEIAIKHALGQRRRDPMILSGAEAWRAFLDAQFIILSVTAEHAAAVDDLPPIHADPFDRMLVAQALTEPMRLLTRDARLEQYGALVTAA